LSMWSKILLTFCLAFGPPAFAEEPADAATPQFTFQDYQQPAPFRGTLFNPRATAELLAMPESLRLEFDLELEYQLDVQSTEFKLRMDTVNSSYTALSEEYKLTVTQKDTEIAELQRLINTSAPSNRAWWIAGGATGGAMITLGIVYAVLSASGK
jgi:hypothetical protein